MPGDVLVDGVEVLLGDAVELDHPAVAHDEAGLRVEGRPQGDKPEVDVLDREAVEVDPLLVHEPDATDDGPAGLHTHAGHASALGRCAGFDTHAGLGTLGVLGGLGGLGGLGASLLAVVAAGHSLEHSCSHTCEAASAQAMS